MFSSLTQTALTDSKQCIDFNEPLQFTAPLCHGSWSPGGPLSLVSSEAHRDLPVSQPDISLWLDQGLITLHSCVVVTGGQKHMHHWSTGPCNQYLHSGNMTPHREREKKKITQRTKEQCCNLCSNQNVPWTYKVNYQESIWCLKASGDFGTLFLSCIKSEKPSCNINPY